MILLRLLARLVAADRAYRDRVRMARLDPHLRSDAGLLATIEPDWPAPAHWINAPQSGATCGNRGQTA
jgi:hypothetical protein